MTWRMRMCRNGTDPIVEKAFENFEDGVDWLRQNEPGILKARWKKLDGENYRQYGTDYYWASFERQL